MKTLIIMFIFALFAFTAVVVSAKQVSVDVIEPTSSKTLNAEVVNITAGTDIDVTTALVQNDKTQVATAFGFTVKEKQLHEDVMAGTPIDPNDIGAYVASLQKVPKLSGDEANQLYFKGKKSDEVEKYFYAKQKKELGL